MCSILHFMDAEKLGKLLAKRRAELGLTQEALALRAKISRRTVIAIEAGEADLGLRRLLRVCLALGLELGLSLAHERPTEENLRAIFEDDE